VTGLRIANVARIDDAEKMGHSFNTIIDLVYTGADPKRSCSLQWFERTDVPYVAGMAANTWTDMTQIPRTASSFSGTWGARKEPCPGSETVTDFDPPSIAKRPGRTVMRTLEFRIVVNSGSGCTCGSSQLQVTATQVLAMDNAAPDWANSRFP
jgi:hypothetical protein